VYRDENLEQIVERSEPWDFAVIGGGSTGVGIAVDAAARGYDVALFEQSDFGKGTSSRSTKLVHGGVRYLQQGNISLVMEALKERGLLRANAPHLVHDLAFIVPNYDWWEAPFYGVGMKVYDMLAGKYGFGKSRLLSRDEVVERIPNLERDGLRGGVLYYDGQFDDARLLINLAQSAAEHGAALINYARVTGFSKNAEGFVDGVEWEDLESGQRHQAPARCVINAAGPFCDEVRRLDDPRAGALMAPSQGVHLVLDRAFLAGESAIMVPHTKDGRVMFAIPWHGHVVVGTTDTPIDAVSLEPRPFDEEIEFILETAAPYLEHDPAREDVLSVFTGIRPLVRAHESGDTSQLSREHAIHVSGSGLLTIAGGKWTTYRHMAEQCVDHAVMLADLPERPCVTRSFHLHGYHSDASRFGELAVYGSSAAAIRRLMRSQPGLDERLHEAVPVFAAQVVWAARYEMARTIDDVLARRTRVLQLNARAAREMAPRVGELLAAELGRDEAWQQAELERFDELSRAHLLTAPPDDAGEARQRD
jgi:glycerol-3-phosphate dehydrogenase